MCNRTKRTTAESKVFRKSLRRAIEFVDAQHCKPSEGKVCARDCKKIRTVMCNYDAPCQSKVCIIWYGFGAHIEHCLNPNCELKYRVMLRETDHLLISKTLDLVDACAAVRAKRPLRVCIKQEGIADKSSFHQYNVSI
uniref:Uncharacterized protein n=1 Tax=Globisporangium ultimum (strain ATCC 200006 / CBS 805.95 / DAOM BR144) TaxID=431595 RepID=K3W7Z9_GLOUD